MRGLAPRGARRASPAPDARPHRLPHHDPSPRSRRRPARSASVVRPRAPTATAVTPARRPSTARTARRVPARPSPARRPRRTSRRTRGRPRRSASASRATRRSDASADHWLKRPTTTPDDGVRVESSRCASDGLRRPRCLMTSATQTPTGAAGAGVPGAGDRELAALRAEVESLREVARHSPQRTRELEARLAHVQTSLSTLSSQNERLVRTLKDAREQIVTLKKEVDRLAQPPSTYGLVVDPPEDGVDRHPHRRPQDARRGQPVGRPGGARPGPRGHAQRGAQRRLRPRLRARGRGRHGQGASRRRPRRRRDAR